MTEWDDWLANQDKTSVAYPLRIRQMWTIYGKSEGNKCGDCAHMLRKRLANVYRKCDKTKMTAGPATDWKASWPACGLFAAAEPAEKETL